MAEFRLKVSIGAASDKGTKPENEDFFGSLVADGDQLLHKGIAVLIADGMSGSEGGKQASSICVSSFLSDYYATPESWTVKQAGQKILSALNSWLYSQGHTAYQSAQGMVSTLSILILKSATAHVFHIGDSRIYRLRRGNLEQISHDHRIWASEQKHYLSRAMGIEPHIEIDYKAMPLENGDLFVLTTDGVHDYLEAKALKTLLLDADDLAEAAAGIIGKAALNKSDDNLTCQLVRIDELPEAGEDEILRRHCNLPFPPPLDVGRVIDSYRIEAELHASKRTQIYRARDLKTGATVVLKTPSILYDDDTYYIEHFLQEEWAGKRLNHNHVVKVPPSDRKKSHIYYVMEFIDGQTLRDWRLANPKPYIREIRKIAEQIAKGLRAFHRLEMLHQDLKPENIMIDHNGVVKIIDFGSVKIAGIAELTPLEQHAGENVLGTRNYTAPEYHLGHRGTVKSDLFSLGVITYELINGALPFGPMPEKPDAISLAKLRYTPSFHHNVMVPLWIDGALKKATAINPQMRYDTLSEFIYDLSNPNPKFLTAQETIPLIEQNPLLFWKCLSILLLVANLVLLYWLMRRF